MTVDLAVQSARKFAEGLREFYDLAKAEHASNPTPEGAASLEELKRSIDEFDRLADDRASRPVMKVAGKVVGEVVSVSIGSRSRHDPVKAAADRAEARSRDMRAKGISGMGQSDRGNVR